MSTQSSLANKNTNTKVQLGPLQLPSIVVMRRAVNKPKQPATAVVVGNNAETAVNPGQANRAAMKAKRQAALTARRANAVAANSSPAHAKMDQAFKVQKQVNSLTAPAAISNPNASASPAHTEKSSAAANLAPRALAGSMKQGLSKARAQQQAAVTARKANAHLQEHRKNVQEARAKLIEARQHVVALKKQMKESKEAAKQAKCELVEAKSKLQCFKGSIQAAKINNQAKGALKLAPKITTTAPAEKKTTPNTVGNQVPAKSDKKGPVTISELEKLKKLTAMGFVRPKLNLRVIRNHPNNFDAVVARLTIIKEANQANQNRNNNKNKKKVVIPVTPNLVA